MSSVLIIGSVALDSVETPAGKVEDELGGSASYASLAASMLEKTHILGVVGKDFPTRFRRLLQRRNVNIANLMVEEGKTFRWSGSYQGGMNEAQTRSTDLNVFEKFRPELKDDLAQIPYVFLANIDPELQINILDQLKNRKFVACDTMNYWITSKKEAVTEVFKRSDAVLVNLEEARSFTGQSNTILAAKEIMELGPQFVVIKKGEHGSMLFWGSGQAYIPAFPVTRLEDPTGAGDTFAGSMVGWIAHQKRVSNRVLVEACVIGTAMASFTCEGFGVSGLIRASAGRLRERCLVLHRLCDLPIIRIRGNLIPTA